MTIRWHRRSPLWLSIIVAVFGLLNVLAAIRGWSDMTLPGIFVGSVWFLAGYKGTPIISVTDGPAGEIQDGIQIIRRRRLAAYLVPPIWLFGSALIVAWLAEHDLIPKGIPESLIPGVFILWATPIFVVGSLFQFSECPRCHNNFFFRKHLSLRLPKWSWNVCENCELDLR